MSELVSNPQELAQQLADQHRAAQAEAAVHQFVDVTNEESLNDFNSYLESRPTEDATEDATEDVGTDMLKKSHYDETLAETANQYEEMSMTELAKELAEATVAKDTTKLPMSQRCSMVRSLILLTRRRASGLKIQSCQQAIAMSK